MFQFWVMVVVFHNILSFMITKEKNQMLPLPYVGSYLSEKGHQFFHKPWILALSKSFEIFILVSISDMPTIKYSQNLGRTTEKSKEMIPKECRIGDICFTSLATIRGNLYTRHANNVNNVNKDSEYLLSVVIILVTNVSGGETFIYDGENMNDIGKIAHVLKHSHGGCVIGSFDKILHEASIWTSHRAFLSFILDKSIFPHFVHIKK